MIHLDTTNKMPMEQLWRLALKYCFDRSNVSYMEEQKMRESCFLWHNYIEQFKETSKNRFKIDLAEDSRPIGTKGTYIDEIEFYLGIICYHVEGSDNQRPWILRRRITYIEHGIDYKKAYKLAGSWTKEDFVRAMKDLKKNMADRPEEYV